MADERDSKVSRRYRELGSEEPPRELDESILRAARRANDGSHAPLVTPAGRHRWYYVFGAAAIMVLAVAVTVQIERQRPDPEFGAAAPVPQPHADDSAFKAPSTPAAPAPKHETPPKGAARDAAPQTAPQARSPVPENKTAEAQKPEARLESAPRPAPAAPAESRADETAIGAASSSQAPAPAARARMAEQGAESPERWLERIVQLRKEGRHDEAEKQLAEFRKRYPDYKVPETALK
ncbi:MAG TPA: hypothetical protein VJT77_09635 [Burkholderiales bacterium]|nr:hypothetical protein [Burkholderiales bacterium]